MAIIVQKYGGTSVGDLDKLRQVARRVAARFEAGDSPVVAVSAMGKTTDELIALARQVNADVTIGIPPAARELDMLMVTGEHVSASLLALTLQAMGHPAVSLGGHQAGFRTDQAFGKARILNLEPERILREVREGKIVVVAGFHGSTEDGDTATFGRGGSDTTAVALAAALGARVCEIYTDVEGVLTADPRVVPDARKLDEISYDEMLELASYGARVMHNRAVELAAIYRVPILVASTFGETPGTLIHGGPSVEQRSKVRGVAYDIDVAKLTLLGVPDRPGIAATIFEPLGESNISVDTIVQNVSHDNLTDLTFTVARGELEQARAILEPFLKDVGARGLEADASVAKVSIVGTGMQNAPGYASRMFRALADGGINIQMISTSEIRITCIVDDGQVTDAVRVLHEAFGLATISG
ncbi:MAG: aspartate kinase [Dehalococcoidia bacterium]|nr:aspartate kinase [Dehalococcoidia bacterium]